MEQSTIHSPPPTIRLTFALLFFVGVSLAGLGGCGGGSSANDPDPEPGGEVSTQQSPAGDAETVPENDEAPSPETTEPEPSPEPQPSPSPEPAPEPSPEPAPEPSPEPVLAPPPSNFRVEIDDSTAIFRWDPVEGAEKYTLYIAEEQGVSPENYASYRGGKMLDDVTSPYRYDIPRGKPYYAIITATIDGKEGTPSAELGIRVPVVFGEKPLTLVSVASGGGILPKSKGGSQEPAISYYGRYVAFSSFSDRVVPGDSNGVRDVFVHDRLEKRTIRVSIASDGTQGNGDSRRPSISGDGRLVVFQSSASNLVKGDTNGVDDIFIHDLRTGETRRISTSSTGAEGNGKSDYPVISSDGRFIAFRSAADNLVEGDLNGKQDIFLYERESGKVTLISVSSSGEQGNDFSGAPSISAHGRYIAFRSEATNLHPKGIGEDPDILVRNWKENKTELVSVNNNGESLHGEPLNPDISSDGRYVVYQSNHGNLYPGQYENWKADIILYDRVKGESTIIPPEREKQRQDKLSANPSISGDGNLIVFQAERGKLRPSDKNGKVHDVFLYDRTTGETIRISEAEGGKDANTWSTKPVISADGSTIVFQSKAGNLVAGDNNGSWDIFVFDRRVSSTK